VNGLLTAKEAAGKLRVHINTIYSYLECGKLKGHRIVGSRWRIKEADLEAFINGRRAGQAHAEVSNEDCREQVALPSSPLIGKGDTS